MAVYTDILKELRRDKNITQKKMGEYFNITRSTYSLYELGKRPMTAEMLNQLADILDTSTDYLLGRTAERQPYPKRQKLR